MLNVTSQWNRLLDCLTVVLCTALSSFSVSGWPRDIK